MAATAVALGYYWPSLTAGLPRAAFLVALTLAFAAVNIRGIRQASWVVNVLTIGKLVPLAIFVAVGLAFVHVDRLTTLPQVTVQQALAAGLPLIFIYGGYEVVPVPAGEAVDPQRDVPFAMVATIVIVAVVMTLVQIVAQGVLANVADHATPIADAAAAFLGGAGALLIGIGSVVSMTGNNASQVLSGSRMLFALAEHGGLPAFLARVHPRYHTPSNAIVCTSVAAVALALTGSFAQIAVVSALARLLMYASSAAATLRLRAVDGRGDVKPAAFVAPLGPTAPVVAMCVCVALALGATRDQLLGGAAALAVGAALYAWGRRVARD
jgi:amino acid transporter